MEPSATNDPLSRTLAEWRVQPPPDPNFRPGVWQRIRRRSVDTWGTYVQAHRGAWSAVAILAASFAGWAGHQAGRAEFDSQRDAMVTAYLVELDPRVQAELRSAQP